MLDSLNFNLLKSHDSIFVLGPTASGKTSLAVKLAYRFNCEIISADSRQVYKGMDLGTGKDLQEYHINDTIIKLHLVDIINPTQEFNVFDFVMLAQRAAEKIKDNGRIPLVCGGTGMYLSALIQNYRLLSVPDNPELRMKYKDSPVSLITRDLIALKKDLHNKTDLTDKSRALRALEIAVYEKENHMCQELLKSQFKKPFILGTRWDRTVLRQRISRRLDERMDQGLVNEVQALLDSGLSLDKLEWFGLEYRYIGRHLVKGISKIQALNDLKIKIGQFAKKQETWFRRMEKRGIQIHWVDNADFDQALKLLEKEALK
jgi:tRNA dimethylallyltransferase